MSPRRPAAVGARSLEARRTPVRVAVGTPPSEPAADGGDIGVHGSVALTRWLLAHGLVDELTLAVMPVLAGAGARLLEDGHERCRLGLVGASRTAAGVLVLSYRPSAPAGGRAQSGS